jgi:hypothetical protein
MALLGLTLIASGCGREPELPLVERDAVRDAGDSIGLMRRIQADSLAICLDERTAPRKKEVELALSLWLRPLQDLDRTLAPALRYTCATPDLTIETEPVLGRAWARISYDHALIHLYSDSYFRTLLHELGHAFGLVDRYKEAGHPDSVMKLGRYGAAVLYPDDLRQIEAGFFAVVDGVSLRFGPEEACTATDGEAGTQRPVARPSARTPQLWLEGEESRCRSGHPYHEEHYEPAEGACVAGASFFGLYDAWQGHWLPEAGRTYPCGKADEVASRSVRRGTVSW